jgi:hypothetical protein
MSKRYLAIYNEKNNTYLNKLFSNISEIRKEIDKLDIECSISEINKDLFEFLKDKSKTDQSQWISPDGFQPINYKIPYINLEYNKEKLEERDIRWKEIQEEMEEFRGRPNDDSLRFQPWVPISKKIHKNYFFNEGYPWYSKHDDTINNIILEEDDPNMDITGVYMTHLNGDHDIDGLTNHRTLQFHEEPVNLYSWGVSDNANQVKKYIDECIDAYQYGHEYNGVGDFFQGKQLVQFMQAMEEENREYGFVLLLTPIVNEHNHAWGGWRWHKWGEYIGHHKIEHEYLNDEEGVDFVFVWKLIPVVKDEEVE